MAGLRAAHSYARVNAALERSRDRTLPHSRATVSAATNARKGFLVATS
jgi:hypothetical protein